MSSSSGVICSICIESFAACDAISVITCGHVFHEQCIQDWKLRGKSCPDCRFPFYSRDKIFLNFEENYMPSAVVNELRAKVQSYEIELNKLRDQLNERDGNILFMQEQYKTCKDEVKKLKWELNHIKKNEAISATAQKVSTESLPKRSCSRELTAQRGSLKLDDEDDCNKTDDPNDYIAIVKRYPLDILVYPLTHIIITMAIDMNVKITENHISEVHKVDCYSGTAPDTVCLQVQFKYKKARNKFLNNQEKLQKLEKYGSIGIYEYKKNDIKSSLYYYAKAKLRSHGFAAVFTQRDQIMAIYDRKIGKPIRIWSKKQVDQLVNQHK